MDSAIASIADYANSLRDTDLSNEVIHAAKRRIVDTIGCALGAFNDEPGRIARRVAARCRVTPGASVIGASQRTLPELAAFANGVMSRYLDANDAFPGGGGHPSDVISPVLAVADSAGASGRQAILAVTLAYEVYHKLWRGMIDKVKNINLVRDKGVDHVLYCVVGSAVGAAKLLGLDREKIANAVALSVTPNVPLGVTRRGNLSMWKGCAAGNAGRNGVFAALLAAEGLTGPEEAIEGAHGLRELLGKCEITPFTKDGSFRIADSNLKCFASEYHSQSPITAALQLVPQVKVEDIQEIIVNTYWYCWSEIGSEPEKWHPTTRETADHSLPYILSAVLLDGGFSHRIFDVERLHDPRIHQLADKVVVKEDPELTRQFPLKFPCRMEILTKSGLRKTATVNYGRGHIENPMTDEEVNAKFRNLAEPALPKEHADRALERLWKFDEEVNLGAVYATLQSPTMQP